MPSKPGKQGKKRLDLLLFEKGLAESRNKAQALILAGQVSVRTSDGKERPPASLKPGDLFPDSVTPVVHAAARFVSRGGDKLQGALDHWNIAVRDLICLDIGSSTGGFTDCLLQNGAREVTAVDVGYGQLHPKLRHHPQVRVFEETHILKWKAPWEESAAPRPVFATIDVSFISLEKILNRVYELMDARARVLALVKPQFEVGPKHIKKGIVRDDAVRAASIQKIAEFAVSAGFRVEGHSPCPVLGMKGNREEWLFLIKEGTQNDPAPAKILQREGTPD